ncbi:hypothetical protein L6164_036420 [Bauhinia variegata]|uniref:Uncharacterized protein n=1 Tax=Bauhinia variegata TaxID=167791 RepID=A0ACB9KH35_BAUVA|nr:hypothetical protein L6164_036420 [Bauhinia variegata]
MTTASTTDGDQENLNGAAVDEDEVSPIEEVRLTVTNTDDPTLPVWTFRMWFLGLLSCALLSFLNQFFSYRTEPLVITQLTVQVAVLPIGHFMAAVLPTAKFRLPGLGSKELSFNPGPFNMKEHVLITIFANAGSAFGAGHPTLHEKDKDNRRLSRAKFFFIALVCSFSWYVIPGYLFKTLGTISWVCWIFSKSVTAQQIGSGMQGLGLGSFTLDWTVVSSFLFSPLISPFFAIVNVFVGYALFVWVVIPIAYWGFNVYGANKFPIFSSDLFDSQGQTYNVTAIVNNQFELNFDEYRKLGRINLSVFFALSYGFGFATIAATITHVACFYGREIMDHYRSSSQGKEDIHTKLMKKYEDIPSWWFYLLLSLSIVISLVLCIVLNDQTPGLNIITEYLFGLIYPGRPIANVCFKTYGYISMAQAVSFLSDFKLGHYMKIPPRSMFLVQFIGTVLAGTINIGVGWWLLTSVKNICHDDPNSGSPWTCPGDRVFFDASVIWGLVGPQRIFGKEGYYKAMNLFFIAGALGPVLLWLLYKKLPKQSWIPLINLPVLLGATGAMPPATPLNYNAWIVVGTIFNFFVFRYRKQWWQRYNYVLSAALDAGVAFMTVLLYFSLGLENKSLHWWGTQGEHCPLASCPTAKGIVVDGCPVQR